MATKPSSHRLTASTALHKGDRAYQQDQVSVLPHPREAGCLLMLVADGMGGKSGGRKAADQVQLTAKQVFQGFVPALDDPVDMLRRLVAESHLMIKLTAISTEEEPHSTLAAALLMPDLSAHVVHAGDSRVYLFRGAQLLGRTTDHSFVQRLVDEGKITEQEALNHPQANLLSGCLGTEADPPISFWRIDRMLPDDTLMVCSDGLWHYFSDKELGAIVHALPPREACEMLLNKARQRASGGGDNLSLAIVRVDHLN
jgi:serine/threonine protein phosphatase PrpC